MPTTVSSKQPFFLPLQGECPPHRWETQWEHMHPRHRPFSFFKYHVFVFHPKIALSWKLFVLQTSFSLPDRIVNRFNQITFVNLKKSHFFPLKLLATAGGKGNSSDSTVIVSMVASNTCSGGQAFLTKIKAQRWKGESGGQAFLIVVIGVEDDWFFFFLARISRMARFLVFCCCTKIQAPELLVHSSGGV